MISPGLGWSEESGIACAAIERYAGKRPILGICLGHQAIGQVMGGEVTRAKRPVHDKTWEVFHDDRWFFHGLRNPFLTTRYYSLIVPEASVKPPLSVSAAPYGWRGHGPARAGADAGGGAVSPRVHRYGPRYDNLLHRY